MKLLKFHEKRRDFFHKKIRGTCRSLSPEFFFFESSLYLYRIIFQINGCQSDVLKIIFVVIVMSVLPKFTSFVRFQYFRPILGSWWSFPARTCHNPSNIHFSLLNPIKLPLKFIKSFWNTFWIIFKGSILSLHRLII